MSTSPVLSQTGLNLGANPISNMADPVNAQDGATKNSVAAAITAAIAAIPALTSSNVTTALGYTPAHAGSNADITALTALTAISGGVFTLTGTAITSTVPINAPSFVATGAGTNTAITVSVPTVFATAWDMSSVKDMGGYSITGPLALTSVDTGSVQGGYTQATLIANGTNSPTFDGTAIAGFTNTTGARNWIELKRIGNSKYIRCITTLGAAISGVA